MGHSSSKRRTKPSRRRTWSCTRGWVSQSSAWPLREGVKEPLLERPALIRGKGGPGLDPMNLQPLLRRGGAHEALDVATQVEAVATPVPRGQKGHSHPRPHRRAGFVVVVVREDRTLMMRPTFGDALDLARQNQEMLAGGLPRQA